VIRAKLLQHNVDEVIIHSAQTWSPILKIINVAKQRRWTREDPAKFFYIPLTETCSEPTPNPRSSSECGARA